MRLVFVVDAFFVFFAGSRDSPRASAASACFLNSNRLLAIAVVASFDFVTLTYDPGFPRQNLQVRSITRLVQNRQPNGNSTLRSREIGVTTSGFFRSCGRILANWAAYGFGKKVYLQIDVAFTAESASCPRKNRYKSFHRIIQNNLCKRTFLTDE